MASPPFYSSFTHPFSSTIPPPSPNLYGYPYSSYYNHEQQLPLPCSQPQPPPPYTPTPNFHHSYSPPSPNPSNVSNQPPLTSTTPPSQQPSPFYSTSFTLNPHSHFHSIWASQAPDCDSSQWISSTPFNHQNYSPKTISPPSSTYNSFNQQPAPKPFTPQTLNLPPLPISYTSTDSSPSSIQPKPISFNKTTRPSDPSPLSNVIPDPSPKPPKPTHVILSCPEPSPPANFSISLPTPEKPPDGAVPKNPYIANADSLTPPPPLLKPSLSSTSCIPSEPPEPPEPPDSERPANTPFEPKLLDNSERTVTHTPPPRSEPPDLVLLSLPPLPSETQNRDESTISSPQRSQPFPCDVMRTHTRSSLSQSGYVSVNLCPGSNRLMLPHNQVEPTKPLLVFSTTSCVAHHVLDAMTHSGNSGNWYFSLAIGSIQFKIWDPGANMAPACHFSMGCRVKLVTLGTWKETFYVEFTLGKPYVASHSLVNLVVFFGMLVQNDVLWNMLRAQQGSNASNLSYWLQLISNTSYDKEMLISALYFLEDEQSKCVDLCLRKMLYLLAGIGSLIGVEGIQLCHLAFGVDNGNYTSTSKLTLSFLQHLHSRRHTHFGVNSLVCELFICSCVLDVLVCLDILGYVLVMFKDIHWFGFGSIEASCGSGKPLVIFEDDVFMSYLGMNIGTCYEELAFSLLYAPSDVLVIDPCFMELQIVWLPIMGVGSIYSYFVLRHIFNGCAFWLRSGYMANANVGKFMQNFHGLFIIVRSDQSHDYRFGITQMLATTLIAGNTHFHVFLCESPHAFVVQSLAADVVSSKCANSASLFQYWLNTIKWSTSPYGYITQLRMDKGQQWDPGEHFQNSKVLWSSQFKQWDPGKKFQE